MLDLGTYPEAAGRRLIPYAANYWYRDACSVNSSAYVPPRASNSECVPDSTTRPSFST